MAFTSAVAGQKLRASQLNGWFDAATPLKARTTAATTFTSSTTYADITGLLLPVATNSVYKLDGWLRITGANATHDLKLQIVLPAGATIAWSAIGGNTAISAQPTTVDLGITTATNLGARGTFAGSTSILLTGFITTGATAGSVQLQGAQNTSDPGVLSFDAGSEMHLMLWA
jgi:hypothetical protein